jgi:SAM-dependent methyltransferase
VSPAEGLVVPGWVLDAAEYSRASAPVFLTRLPVDIAPTGKSVLDVGCGRGDLGLEVARRGARRVLGVDIDPEPLRLAEWQRSREPPHIASSVEFRVYGGSLDELGDERFDVVLSKDSFEHYGADPASPSPETMVEQMIRALKPAGLLAIGFGPLWRSPTGGHIDTYFPWAHLLFPESVIFAEFRRARSSGTTARTFEQGVGVNRMTLARFRSIMRATPLQCLGLETNVSDNPVVKIMDVMSKVPGLAEYFTANVYGVWRLPD